MREREGGGIGIGRKKHVPQSEHETGPTNLFCPRFVSMPMDLPCVVVCLKYTFFIYMTSKCKLTASLVLKQENSCLLQ